MTVIKTGTVERRERGEPDVSVETGKPFTCVFLKCPFVMLQCWEGFGVIIAATKTAGGRRYWYLTEGCGTGQDREGKGREDGAGRTG